MQNQEVIPAFEMLLGEIEEVVKQLNQEGADLLTSGKYDDARALIAKVETINTIQNKVEALLDDWHKLSIKPAKKKVRKARKPKPKSTSRLEKGLRTSEESLKIPLLKTLVKMGGAGKVSDVLDNMEPLIKDILNEIDYEPLQSTDEQRWRNTTKWARADMIKEGLLDKDSPYGVWTISAYGREWLEEQTGNVSNQSPGNEQTSKAGSKTKPSQEERSVSLEQIIEVCHEIFDKGKNYNEAVQLVADRRGLKSFHTVSDKCTRQLDLNTSEFKELTKDKFRMMKFLIDRFPDDQYYIIEQLSS